ncbi:hypothetical protein QZH41_002528 [Actinostola sp. cb2023]|nr:hypothetical protein QZH41_002528 [Actinostola sp. cb2023]
MSSFAVRALLLASLLVAPGSTKELVLTKQGYIKGIQESFIYKGQNQTIYKFLGVPYAEKPIGDLRFKRPQSLKSWRLSVYNATYFRPVCIQDARYFKKSIQVVWPEFTAEKGIDEDCLYLNIYTPRTILAKRYPVIVYIHGGSFIAGTPVRDVSPGEFMPVGGVVLVTVQYRLGTFGFFSTGTSEAPGNVGLLDQVAALKWVQENIAGFGGDPNSVTLLGESAGGASVTFHYLTPLSKGLFHRAIAVSGVDLSPFATRPKDDVTKISAQIAKNLNCYSRVSSEMLQCLRTLPSSSFINTRTPNLTPFVDSYFLPDDPKKMREEGRFHKLPLMSGFVSHEGSFILKQRQPEYNIPGFKEYLGNFLQHEFHQKNEFALDALEFQYTPWVDVHDRHKIRKKLVDMLTDYFVAAPTHAVLTMHSDSGAPTYMFEFSHRSKLKESPEWMGVVHGDTTAYKFGAPLLNTRVMQQFDNDDKNISDMLVHLYLNFAKFGDPTPTPVYGTRWHTYNSSTKAYLKIQKNPMMESNFHPARMAFWNHYFPRLIPPEPRHPPGVQGSRNDAAMSTTSMGPDIPSPTGLLVRT